MTTWQKKDLLPFQKTKVNVLGKVADDQPG